MRTVVLKKSKYSKLYEWVLDDIKDRYSISVIHRKLSDAFGCNDTDKRLITIDSEIAGTVFGLFTVYHELYHTLHQIDGKYSEFYERILYGDIEGLDVEKIVWKVEWECCFNSLKQLRRLGIEIHNQFCDKHYLKRVILPIWVSYYSK